MPPTAATVTSSEDVTSNETVLDDLFIHPHWLQFDLSQIPDWHFYTVGVLVGAIGIVGILGNGLVILTYFRQRALRTPPNMFIINLATSDLVFSAVNGFPLFTVASFQRRWNWGMRACELYGMLGGVFGLISIYTNAAIAVDRFLVIVQPIQSMQRMTRARAGVIIAFIWVWCSVVAMLPIGGYGRYIPEGFQTSCSFDYLSQDRVTWSYNIALYTLAFLLPLTVIILCYYRIVLAVARHEQEMIKMAQKLGKDMRSGNSIRADIKTAKVSATIIVFWLMTWVPYAGVCFLGVLGYTAHLGPYVTEIPVLFAKASAMYNPVIYAVSHPKFREGMRAVAPCVFACCGAEGRGRGGRGGSGRASRTSQSSDAGSTRRGDVVMKTQSTASVKTVSGDMEDSA